MKPIDPDGFEAMFQRDSDPWNYAGSPFEAFKRRVLIRACGTRIYGRGLELACANGETSRHLARRCLGLLAVDVSPTVIAAARGRVRDRRVTFSVARLPAETPRGPFDLIVASEILYYMSRSDMDALLHRLIAALAPGGRIVILHHTLGFDDAAQPPWAAQAAAKARLGRRLLPVLDARHRRFGVVAFVRPAKPTHLLRNHSGGMRENDRTENSRLVVRRRSKSRRGSNSKFQRGGSSPVTVPATTPAICSPARYPGPASPFYGVTPMLSGGGEPGLLKREGEGCFRARPT